MARPTIDIDMFDEGLVREPFEAYEQIRAAGRVVWSTSLNGWLVTGFDDCTTVLTDDGRQFHVLNGNPEYFPWVIAPNMLTVDGDEHERLRRALVPHFTRSEIAKWEVRVQSVVDRLLARLIESGASMDLIADFTMIPTVIVAEMLGIPQERHDDFRRWSHTIVSGHSYGRLKDAAVFESLRQAGIEMNAYLAEEVSRHRAAELDDLITAMLGDGQMTDPEIMSASFVMMGAGYDTTAQLLSTALVVLEQHPDQRTMVASDPSLIPNMIEEVLRWVGVTQLIPRGVTVDTTFAGTELLQGEVVFTIPPAAGRDPSRWDDPARFDVRRSPRAHLGFGFGPHLCLGAPLARLEAKVALGRMLEIAPEYRLSDLQYGKTLFARGPISGTIEANTIGAGV